MAYRFARDAARISIAEIIPAVGVPVDAIYGKGRRGGRGKLDSTVRRLWSGLNAFLLDYFAGVSLDQVIESHYAKPVGLAARRDIRSGMHAHAAAQRWSTDETGSLPH